MIKQPINGEAALRTLRRMIDEQFYDDGYILNWIDKVLAGEQNPHQSMTQEVRDTLEPTRRYMELLHEGVHEGNVKELFGGLT